MTKVIHRKKMLFSYVVFDINVFSFMVQKKSAMMGRIHMKKWDRSMLMLLQSYL